MRGHPVGQRCQAQAPFRAQQCFAVGDPGVIEHIACLTCATGGLVRRQLQPHQFRRGVGEVVRGDIGIGCPEPGADRCGRTDRHPPGSDTLGYRSEPRLGCIEQRPDGDERAGLGAGGSGDPGDHRIRGAVTRALREPVIAEFESRS